MIKIAPSLLAADFAALGTEIARVEKAGADMLHLDIMDGHFVPNITFGPQIVRRIRQLTSLPLDVHLMISKPEHFVEEFADAGADIISFHVEAGTHAHRLLGHIRDLGKIPGIALNPSTPPETIYYVLNMTKVITVMTVNPGFGGQEFIPEMLPKIKLITDEIKRRQLDVAVHVDGGIGPKTAQAVVAAGASVLVAGSAVFGAQDATVAIRAIRDCGGGDAA